MKFTVSLALCLVALSGFALSAPSASKVSLALQRSLQTKSRVNILVSMKEDTTAALNRVSLQRFSTHVDQVTAVYNSLTAFAAESQKAVLQMLNSPRHFTTKVQSFWITNQVFVAGADQSLIDALVAMDDVSQIVEDEIIYLDEPINVEGQGTLAEWGIDKIQAQEAWAAGSNGAGAVVGIIDTGARYTHEAIRDNYRGGTHSWYDPYSQTQNPGDGNGHGTHCTGTIAGVNGIGVAPGAKWISCKGLQDNGGGSTSALISCGQFMTCPTTYNGGSPNCALAPHVVSNSWGGGNRDVFYNDVLNAWATANIIGVFANGNSGSSCSTTLSPADSIAPVIAVGATTSTDAIASFSSRGPGLNTASPQKPDVSAPGQDIRSADYFSDTAYSSKSGTSMACPHVAGVVALLKGKTPGATLAQIKTKLQNTTDRNLVFDGQVCGGVQDNAFPNFKFGFGRVNALKAVQA